MLQGLENKKTYELNEEEVNKIRDEVAKYTTEADLVRSYQNATACCQCQLQHTGCEMQQNRLVWGSRGRHYPVGSGVLHAYMRDAACGTRTICGYHS